MGFFDEEPGPRTIEPWRAEVVRSIQEADCRGVHNFCVGPLIAYFRLLDLARENVEWDGSVLVLSGLPGAFRRKVFSYGSAPDLGRLAELQTGGVVYTQAKISLLKRSAFKETAYDLRLVFDPHSYPNARKRSKRLVQPFCRLDRANIQIRWATPEDYAEIATLHEDWINYKLNDPTTMRNMFPKVRYLNCVRLSLVDILPNFKTMVAKDKTGGLISARCIYTDNKSAYDLAFFSRQWEFYSNIVEDIATKMLKFMLDDGLETINCGASLNKGLTAFKNHWPSYHPVSYAYGRIK